MDIVLAVFGTCFLGGSLLWAFLPGMFGLANYKRHHSPSENNIASITWAALLLINPVAGYLLWDGIINNKEYVFSWLFLPLPFHIIFFSIFGRNLGTS